MIVSGKKIKEYREKRSMTKAELSKNAGVPYDTLMSWEMERRIPRDVSLVAQVSRELGVSIEDLIDGSGTSNFSDSDNVKYQHKDGRELLGDLDDFLESWTIHRNEFILLFGADGIICILVLLLISQIFTRNLEKNIMEPLDLLAQGADRIRHNDLTTEIRYVGDAEFEDVCITFNHMQEHILREQEKNRKYEKARTDMIAGISHDLRTPLTAIRGTIKGLMDGIAATPEMQEKFCRLHTVGPEIWTDF